MSIPVEAALSHLARHRREKDIVISNQASARLWPRLSQHRLDYHYNPSTMGGAIPFGIGLALARPDHEVIILSGDGSLLMSLGTLVTAVASGVTNLTILLLDNNMYEVTGGQKTAASDSRVDYPGMARAAGFSDPVAFDRLQDWVSASEAFFAASGPRFAQLSVGPTPQHVMGDTLPPIDVRIRDFETALRTSAD